MAEDVKKNIYMVFLRLKMVANGADKVQESDLHR